MLLYRTLSSFVLWLMFLGLVFSDFVNGAFILCVIVALIAQWEFYSMQKKRGHDVFQKTGIFCGALLFGFYYLHFVMGEGKTDFWIAVELLVILLAILGAISRPVFMGDRDKAVVAVALTLLGFFYVPYLFGFILKILFFVPKDLAPDTSQGFFQLLYLLAVTKTTDMGAYAAGSLFGHHKMNPTISPKKTWEGFVGGLIVSLLTSICLTTFIPHHLGFLSGWHAWILGCLLAVIGVIGDLGESLIKRVADIKDSGQIIPGIGGALDLIDSLLFTAPVFYCYLLFAFGS